MIQQEQAEQTQHLATHQNLEPMASLGQEGETMVVNLNKAKAVQEWALRRPRRPPWTRGVRLMEAVLAAAQEAPGKSVLGGARRQPQREPRPAHTQGPGSAAAAPGTTARTTADPRVPVVLWARDPRTLCGMCPPDWSGCRLWH